MACSVNQTPLSPAHLQLYSHGAHITANRLQSSAHVFAEPSTHADGYKVKNIICPSSGGDFRRPVIILIKRCLESS